MSSDLKGKAIEVLKGLYDPEIPINVWDLGLVYELRVGESGDIYVLMTLTAPGCPLASSLVSLVEDALKSIDGVREVTVELTFNPPWDPSRMTPEGRKAFKSLYGYDLIEYWESMHGTTLQTQG